MGRVVIGENITLCGGNTAMHVCVRTFIISSFRGL